MKQLILLPMRLHRFCILSFFLLPLLASNQMSGQSYDLTYIFSDTKWIDLPLEVVHNDTIYLAGSEYLCFDGLVVGMDETGPLFKTNPESGGYWRISDIEWSDETNMLIGCGTWFTSSDLADFNSDGLLVFGIDKDGTLLFKNKLIIAQHPDLYNPFPGSQSLCPTFDNRFIAALGKHLLWYDYNGNLLDSLLNVSNNFLRDIEYLNDSLLMAHTETDIYLISHEGVVTQTINVIGIIQNAVVDEEKIYCLTNEELFVYNLSDQTSFSTNNFFTVIPTPDFLTTNDSSLFIFSKEKFIRLDKSSLTIQNEQNFDQPYTQLSNAITTNDRLYLIGLEQKELGPNWPDKLPHQTFIKSMTIDSMPVFEPYDIELTDLTTDSLVFKNISEIDPEIFLYNYEKLQYHLTVTNQGNVPVHSFAYSSIYYDGFNCSEVRIYHYLDSLNILPGQSFTHHDSTNWLNYHWGSFYIPDLELCLIGPSHHFDQDDSNDCASSPVHIPVSTKEPYWNASFQVFPNPATEQIHFNVEFNAAPAEITVEVLNMQGQKIRIKKLIPGSTSINDDIFIPDLPSGIYLIRLTENGIGATRKVLVY